MKKKMKKKETEKEENEKSKIIWMTESNSN